MPKLQKLPESVPKIVKVQENVPKIDKYDKVCQKLRKCARSSIGLSGFVISPEDDIIG